MIHFLILLERDEIGTHIFHPSGEFGIRGLLFGRIQQGAQFLHGFARQVGGVGAGHVILLQKIMKFPHFLRRRAIKVAEILLQEFIAVQIRIPQQFGIDIIVDILPPVSLRIVAEEGHFAVDFGRTGFGRRLHGFDAVGDHMRHQPGNPVFAERVIAPEINPGGLELLPSGEKLLVFAGHPVRQAGAAQAGHQDHHVVGKFADPRRRQLIPFICAVDDIAIGELLFDRVGDFDHRIGDIVGVPAVFRARLIGQRPAFFTRAHLHEVVVGQDEEEAAFAFSDVFFAEMRFGVGDDLFDHPVVGECRVIKIGFSVFIQAEVFGVRLLESPIPVMEGVPGRPRVAVGAVPHPPIPGVDHYFHDPIGEIRTLRKLHVCNGQIGVLGNFSVFLLQEAHSQLFQKAVDSVKSPGAGRQLGRDRIIGFGVVPHDGNDVFIDLDAEPVRIQLGWIDVHLFGRRACAKQDHRLKLMFELVVIILIDGFHREFRP